MAFNYARLPHDRWEAGILTWMQRTGRRLGAIALLALLVRAVVPSGYMLAAAETAGGRYLTVQMCSGHAAQVVDLDTGKPVDPSTLAKSEKPQNEKSKNDPSQTPCVFAGAPALVEPVSVAESVEFLAERDVDFGIMRDVRPGRGIPAPPPPSTGPPSLI
jgi:hypothetical protein